MEITDILSSKNFNNINVNSAALSKTGEQKDKFKQLLAKQIESGEKHHIKKDNQKIDKKLMDTCIEMESIFVSKMLREMRNTIPEEKLINGGFAEKVFEDMLYDQYALNLSKASNLGIAGMLYNQLK